MNNLDNDLLISAYLDGEVTAEERAHVEQLLATSAEARQLVEELRALRESLKALPKHSLGAGFAQEVLNRAQRESQSAQPAATEVAEAPLTDAKEFPRPAHYPWPFGGRRGITWSLVAAAAAVIIVVASRNQPNQQNQNIADGQKEKMLAQAPKQIQQQLADQATSKNRGLETAADAPAMTAARPADSAAPLAAAGTPQGSASQTFPALKAPLGDSAQQSAPAVPLAATAGPAAPIVDMPVGSAEPSITAAARKMDLLAAPATSAPGAAEAPLGKVAADNEQFRVGRERADGINGASVGKVVVEKAEENQSNLSAASHALAGDAKPGTIASGSLSDSAPAMTAPMDGGKQNENAKAGEIAADDYSRSNFSRGVLAGSGAIAGGASNLEGVNKSGGELPQVKVPGLELQRKTAEGKDFQQLAEQPSNVLFVEVTLSAEAAQRGDFERLLERNNIVVGKSAINESEIDGMQQHDLVGLKLKGTTATDSNSNVAEEMRRDLVATKKPNEVKPDSRTDSSALANEGKFDLARDKTKEQIAPTEAEKTVRDLPAADLKRAEADRNGDEASRPIVEDRRLAIDRGRLFDYQRDAAGSNGNVDLVYVEASPQEIRETLADMKQSPEAFFSVSLLGDRSEKFADGDRRRLALDAATGKGHMSTVDPAAAAASMRPGDAAAPTEVAESRSADNSNREQLQPSVANRAATRNPIASTEKAGGGGGAGGRRGGFGGAGGGNGFGGGGRGASGMGGAQFGSPIAGGGQAAKDALPSQNGQAQSNQAESGKSQNGAAHSKAVPSAVDQNGAVQFKPSQNDIAKPAGDSAGEKQKSLSGAQPAELSQQIANDKSLNLPPAIKENLPTEAKSAKSSPPADASASGSRQKSESETLGLPVGHAYRLTMPDLEKRLGMEAKSADQQVNNKPVNQPASGPANAVGQTEKSSAAGDKSDVSKTTDDVSRILFGGDKGTGDQSAVPAPAKPTSKPSSQVVVDEKLAVGAPSTMERVVFLLRIVDDSNRAAGSSQAAAARESKAEAAKPNAAIAPLNGAPAAAPPPNAVPQK